MENIITENCVVWCDWGRPLEIGAETSAQEYSNIIFKNCDIIHGTWVQLDIQHHNLAYIHHVLFDDIRCEFIKNHQPLKFQESPGQTYEEAEVLLEQPILLGAFFRNGYEYNSYGPGHKGDNIENILFKNIQILSEEGTPLPWCEFVGLDNENMVKNVIIENLTVNGKALDKSTMNLKCNEYVSDIIIK